MLERVIVLQGMRLDQSPRGPRLRTKVAKDWKGGVLIIHNVVNTISSLVLKQHNVSAGSRRKLYLASVSRVFWGAYAVESFFVDVTHFVTSVFMLTSGALTAIVVTDLLSAWLMGISLRKISITKY